MISCYVSKRHVDWDIHLQDFAYAMNTAVHSATGYTPAYLNYGRELRLPSLLDVEDGVSLETTLPKDWADKVSKLKNIYLLVRSNLEDAYKTRSHYYNLRRRNVFFKVGQLVLRKNYVLSSAAQKISAGLMPKFMGPFRITRQISPVTYELVTTNGKPAGRWHVKDLKLASNQTSP
jgi:hypothetical protein